MGSEGSAESRTGTLQTKKECGMLDEYLPEARTNAIHEPPLLDIDMDTNILLGVNRTGLETYASPAVTWTPVGQQAPRHSEWYS